MRGHLIPSLAGFRVQRQAYYGGRWHKLGSTTTGDHGDYSFRFAPAAKGGHDYRVVAPAFDGRAHGYSPVRHVRVR
jgi:hypothetical protein